MKIIYILSIFLFVSFNNVSSAQTNAISNDTLNKGNIKEQFDFINRKSSSFKQYKLIRRRWIAKLQKHVVDSLNAKNNELQLANQKIISLNDTITQLETHIKDLDASLDTVNTEKDNISLLGMSLKKGQYSLMMWSLVFLLFLALLFFIYRFTRSNAVTKEAVAKLSEVEKNFSEHRSRAIEREQALNRKLLDEINKNK